MHFVGLCFGDNWENDLENYYEGAEVDEYLIYTKEEAIKEAMLNHESNYNHAIKAVNEVADDDVKQRYLKVIERGPSISEEQAWEDVKTWGYRINEYGELLSSYNPESRWDWYSIGGRWSGFLPLKARNEDGSVKETNGAYKSEVDWDYFFENKFPPACFITEEGEWFDHYDFDFDGSDDDWATEFKDYLNRVDDNCLITVIDFHI